MCSSAGSPSAGGGWPRRFAMSGTSAQRRDQSNVEGNHESNEVRWTCAARSRMRFRVRPVSLERVD